MAEALEVWDETMIAQELPRIYQIIKKSTNVIPGCFGKISGRLEQNQSYGCYRQPSNPDGQSERYRQFLG